MQVGKSISLEETMQKYLLEAKEQAEEIDSILQLDDSVLEKKFVLKSIKEVLGRNKKLLNGIAEIGEAIEYWKQYPEQYAEIRKRIEQEEKDRF